MVLSLAAACLFISDQEHADRLDELRPTTTAPADPPEIVGVEPAFGTDAGGAEVTITGAHLGPDPEVRFGDVAADVLSVVGGALVVRAPPSPVPDGQANQPVAVTVTTAGGEESLTDAFTYWPDASGLVGATGEFAWFHIVGGYWSTASPDYGRSTLRFTQGADYRYYRYWAPELDACVRITDGVPDYVYEPEFVSIDALAGTATQSSLTAEIELEWNAAEGRFVHYDLLEEHFVPGATYDLSLRGTVGLPEVALPGAFVLPSEYDVTEPDIFADSLPPLHRDQHFAWSTDETGDAFIIQVGMLTEDQSAFDEELYCVARDLGTFTLPGELWTRWASDRFVNVLVGRYRSGVGLLPWNQGQIGVATSLWYYGAARSE